MGSRRNRLWATTKYGPYEIKIFLNPRISFDGVTHQRKSGVVVEVRADLLADPARFDETLIHEFIHVLEYLNPKEAFSDKTVNGCTALAQTVGKGLAQMLRELEMAPRPRKPKTRA